MLLKGYEYLTELFDEDDLDEIDFLDGATNVYRTEEFIVKQHIGFCSEFGRSPVRSISIDTYYYRTKERDLQYDMLFEGDGKRIVSALYNRTYIY